MPPEPPSMPSDAAEVLGVLRGAADAAGAALATITDWGLSGAVRGQYRADLVVDEAVLAVLRAGGLGVLSEESGLSPVDGAPLVIVDPLDGSTNAASGVTWFATSLCAVDADGAWVSLVRNQATGDEYAAIRGEGATRNGVPLASGGSRCAELADAIVALSGYPPRHLGWRQFRALGAAALDLCLVASGRLDAYIDCTSGGAHGVWDYAGALLVCQEAGVPIVDAYGRELLVLDHAARRTPVAAATAALLSEVMTARGEW